MSKSPPKVRMQGQRRYKIWPSIYLRRIPGADGWDEVAIEAHNWCQGVPSDKVTIRLSVQEMDALARFWLQRRIGEE